MAQFDKYVNLIRKRAREYSKKYNIDYDEMESQGFLIYCECLEKYDVSKATFSTYLYTQLNRLGDFAKTYNRQKGCLIQDSFSNEENEDIDNIEDMIISKNYDLPTLNDLLQEAKSELSEQAFQLLKWIIEKEWEKKNKRTPTISMASKYFNISKTIVEKFWIECKDFWNTKGIAFYA